MACECKKGKKRGGKEHSEWFKNLLKEKGKKKSTRMSTGGHASTKPVGKKRRGMSTGGYTGKMELL
jgi:hypothetical protein